VKNRNSFIVLLALLLPAIGVGSCVAHDKRVASDFQLVAVGMSRAQVVDLLGRPRSEIDCNAAGPFKPWQRPDCAEAYLYPSWGQPLIPGEWVVWFDNTDKAIDKYHFVSW
jgi:hypothetical protein